MTDVEAMKRSIEAQLDDYAREMDEYRAFMEWWRSQQPALMFTDEAGIKPAAPEAAE